MKVRIVCYEDVNTWILGKFAIQMQKYLNEAGIEVSIARESDKNYDINHHIIYDSFNGVPSHNDTLMITHIDSFNKLNHLKNVIKVSSLGICMSRETMIKLSKLEIAREKLCYINPAHDDGFVPKKISIGFMSRFYPDGRKREFLLKNLVKEIDCNLFLFKIIGSGWEPLVFLMRNNGFEVEYYSSFDLITYKRLMSEIDYYLYTGIDEGQMGFVDALAAGVKTITTPQGYHLDVENGLTYSFNTYKDLSKIFCNISDEKYELIRSVKNWTWKDYSLKHLEVWNNLLGNKIRLINDYKYHDGINSLIESSCKAINENTTESLFRIKVQLFFLSIKRYFLSRIRNCAGFIFKHRMKNDN